MKKMINGAEFEWPMAVDENLDGSEMTDEEFTAHAVEVLRDGIVWGIGVNDELATEMAILIMLRLQKCVGIKEKTIRKVLAREEPA